MCSFSRGTCTGRERSPSKTRERPPLSETKVNPLQHERGVAPFNMGRALWPEAKAFFSLSLSLFSPLSLSFAKEDGARFRHRQPLRSGRVFLVRGGGAAPPTPLRSAGPAPLRQRGRPTRKPGSAPTESAVHLSHGTLAGHGRRAVPAARQALSTSRTRLSPFKVTPLWRCHWGKEALVSQGRHDIKGRQDSP